MPGGGERLTAMWTRSFIVLWFAMFVAMIGIAMISPLIPVYVREELGGPEIAVALSFAGVTLPMLFLSPIVGRLGDRFGLKPFVAGGFLVYGLGASGYMIASTWEHVVLFRMLSGIGAAAIFPMTLAYVGRLAPPGREGAYAGAFAVSQVLGFGTGPLIGGVIRDAAGTFTVFAAMALLLIGTGLATFVLLPSAERGAEPGAARGGDGSPTATDQAARGPERSWAQLLRFAPVQAAMTVQTVVALGWGAGATFLAIYVISEDGLGTESATFVGLLLASRALIGGVLQPWFGRLADRVSRLRLVMIGLIISSTGHFLIPNVPSATFEVGTLVLAPWLLGPLRADRARRGDRLPRAASDLRRCRPPRRHGLGDGVDADGQLARLPRGLARRRRRRRVVRPRGDIPLRGTGGAGGGAALLRADAAGPRGLRGAARRSARGRPFPRAGTSAPLTSGTSGMRLRPALAMLIAMTQHTASPVGMHRGDYNCSTPQAFTTAEPLAPPHAVQATPPATAARR